jgi:hypothetical protein
MAKSTTPAPTGPAVKYEQQVCFAERLPDGKYRILEGTLKGEIHDLKVVDKAVPQHVARVTIAMRRHKISDSGMP